MKQKPQRLPRPGDAGLWAGVYAAGVIGLASHLTQRSPDPLVVVASILLVAGVYALDRVKLRDRYAESGDHLADAERHYAIRTHAQIIRVLVAMLVLAAATLFVLSEPAMLWTIAAGPIAVTLYAGAPKRAFNLKAVPGLKNVLVALAFVLLSAAALGWPASLASGAVWGALALRVLIDAALCDLDDIHADRAQGTHTIATWLGSGSAAGVLMLAEIPCAIWILSLSHTDAAAVWAIALPASTALLLILRPRRLGDWIDARLGVFAFITLALGWLGQT